MSSKVKYILTFIGGIVAGVILTICFAYVVAVHNGQDVSSSNPNVEMFEKPTQTISVKEFRVIQVLDDGSALATAEDMDHYGTVVLFPAKDETSYYDDQHIDVPKGKVLKQVGTFKYESRQEIVKTVPIVEFFDK